MPTYEGLLLIRRLSTKETAKILRSSAEAIFSEGGFIRKIENLGVLQLPCKAALEGKLHTTANRFVLYFDAAPTSVRKIADELRRDINFIRSNIYKQSEPVSEECTFYDEHLPPPYRKDVQDLMSKMPKRNKNKFKYNSGLDYYPFVR